MAVVMVMARSYQTTGLTSVQMMEKMMTKEKKPIPKRHQGIPRSYKTARKLGYKKATLTFDALSDELRDQFVQFAEYGARKDSVCGVVPSTDPSYFLVCYKDASGRCRWMNVPRGSPIPHG